MTYMSLLGVVGGMVMVRAEVWLVDKTRRRMARAAAAMHGLDDDTNFILCCCCTQHVGCIYDFCLLVLLIYDTHLSVYVYWFVW